MTKIKEFFPEQLSVALEKGRTQLTIEVLNKEIEGLQEKIERTQKSAEKLRDKLRFKMEFKTYQKMKLNYELKGPAVNRQLRELWDKQEKLKSLKK